MTGTRAGPHCFLSSIAMVVSSSVNTEVHPGALMLPPSKLIIFIYHHGFALTLLLASSTVLALTRSSKSRPVFSIPPLCTFKVFQCPVFGISLPALQLEGTDSFHSASWQFQNLQVDLWQARVRRKLCTATCPQQPAAWRISSPLTHWFSHESSLSSLPSPLLLLLPLFIPLLLFLLLPPLLLLFLILF